MTRFDIYEAKPAGMDNYLSNYGWHFSKKMCEWAISMMKDRVGAKVKMSDLSELKEKLKANSIKFEDTGGYDIVYIEAMCRADFFGSSITSDMQVYKYIGDLIGDKDGYDGMPFTRFYADCLARGIVVLWEEMM